MKILLVAKPWKGGLAQYLFDAMQDLFPGQVQWITTYPNNLADYLAYRTGKRAWLRELVARINASNYDCALFINHISAFKDLRTDRKHILWLTDAPTLSTGDCAPFERIYLSDTGYENDLLQAIEPARYHGELAFACHPKIHHPAPPASNQTGCCFIGNRDSRRDVWLKGLMAAQVRPIVYGNYFLRDALFWQHPTLFRQALPNASMGGIYAHYRVALNLHARVVRKGTNMRTFECAAYGIPQVVDHRDGLTHHFAAGTEILISNTPAEMARQIQELLAQPDLATHMAQCARKRALTDHTYYHRLLKLLSDWLPATTSYACRQRIPTLITQLEASHETA
ncbi:MAG: glycosyltransferase [Pseudomonadota bacterium]